MPLPANTLNAINICKHIGCRFYSEPQHGCSKFSSAKNCPVSLIERIEGTAYRLSLPDAQESSHQDAIICAAKAVCPDPVIRLQALRGWPVEAIEYTQASDDFDGTANVQEIHDAIDNLRIGPIPD